MTNTLRAYRLNELVAMSDYVEYSDSSDEHWALRWPPPRERQLAEINIKSGTITRYRHVEGSETIECNPIDWVSSIDRRINYLWSRVADKPANKDFDKGLEWQIGLN